MEQFSRTEHMLGHEKSLKKSKETEIIPSIFSDHKTKKLEINHKKMTGKHTKTWKVNNILLNNGWVKNEMKEEIKKYLETNENEDQQSKICGTKLEESLYLISNCTISPEQCKQHSTCIKTDT